MKSNPPPSSEPLHSPSDVLAILAAALAPLLKQALREEERPGRRDVSASAEPNGERLAFTVTSFCKAHEISTPTYYRLRKEGKGPREMRIGSEVRISVEAAAEWRRAREEDEGQS